MSAALITPSVRADATIAELRRQYAAGMKAVTGIWQNDAEKQAEKNMQKLGPVIDKWAVDRRKWAEVGGHSEEGTRTWLAYSWDRWFAEGREHADAIKVHTEASYDAGFFTGVVAPTITKTAADVKQGAENVAAAAVNWAPILLGVVALVAVAVIATQGARVLSPR